MQMVPHTTCHYSVIKIDNMLGMFSSSKFILFNISVTISFIKLKLFYNTNAASEDMTLKALDTLKFILLCSLIINKLIASDETNCY